MFRYLAMILFSGLGMTAVAQPLPLTGTSSILASFHNLNIQGIAIDSTGATVVAGTTTQAGYPTTPGAVQRDYRSTSCLYVRFPQPCTDSYVARIARDGTVLYGSYFGGSSDDEIIQIAIDESNAIYLLGNTNSLDFPFTKPSSNPTSTFLIKIDAGGNWNFSLRMPPGLTAYQVRAGGNGEIVLAGSCTPDALPWSASFYTAGTPSTAGACYVRLAPNGQDVVAATILGGSNQAIANDIALDGDGNVYLAGKSFPADFPTTANSWIATTKQTYYDFTLFAAGISRDGTTLLGSAMFNGEGYDDAPRIALTPGGEVIVAGATQSDRFPVTSGAFQTRRLGPAFDHNLFAIKLTSDLSKVVFSTYLSGEGEDSIRAVWGNADGSVTLIGDTESTLFPTTPDAQERCLMADYYPTFVPYLTRIAADGTSLVYSSYLNQGLQGAAVGAAAATDTWALGLTYGMVLLLDPSKPAAESKFCAVNAANLMATGITAGEILTIFGSHLSNSQILFDGQPGSVLYASEGQVNTIVPDSVTVGSNVKIEALQSQVSIASTQMPAVANVAGLFREFKTNLVIANDDEGIPINEENPAKPGSIVRVYGTGFGEAAPVISLGGTIAPPVSSSNVNGVVEFRIQVPDEPASDLLTIDFSLTGIFFQVTGLKLPVALDK